jgi:hypothetical protein
MSRSIEVTHSVTTEELRQRYRPQAVKVLFVGESPPHRGTFFYDDARPSNLRRLTERVVRDVLPRRVGLDFLSSFARLGCYLDDLSLEPTDHLADDDRDDARRAGEGPLAIRIRRSEPKVVMGIGIGCRDSFQRAHRSSGVTAPLEVLPFPNWPRNVERYVEDLQVLIRHLERRRMFGR